MFCTPLSYVPGLGSQFPENLCKDKGKIHILIFTGNVQNFTGWFDAGRIQITLADRIDYRNREFWCKGYYVDTVGKNERRIAEYIENQLKEDELGEQLVIPGTSPFTGRK